MKLRGSLDDLGISEILYVVGISHRSGLLSVESRGREFRVLFQDGRIVACRQGRNPVTEVSVLERLGICDSTHHAVLDLQAKREATTVLALLEKEGRLTPTDLAQRLQGDIERTLGAVLELRDGSFEFGLAGDPESAAADFGGLLLPGGLEPSRLPGVADRSRGGALRSLEALSLQAGPHKRQARLLVPEDEISLPSLGARPPSPPGKRRRDERAPVADAPAAASWQVVVIAATDLVTERVLQGLPAAGLSARRVANPDEVDRLVAALASQAQGRPDALVVVSTDPSLPGLEVLARVRSVDRLCTVVLVAGEASPRDRARVRDRARTLGATHVVSAGLAAPEFADHSDLAARVAALCTPPMAPTDTPPLVTLDRAAGDDLEGLPVEAGQEQAPLARSSPTIQARTLGDAADDLGDNTAAPLVAQALLAQAGEFFARGILMVRHEESVAPLGAFVRSGLGGGAGAMSRRVARAALGENLLGETLRSNRPFSGRPPEGRLDRVLVESLGGRPPARLAILPLRAEGACFGALYGDDAGGHESAADLTAFTAFVESVAPLLHAALAAGARAAQARHLRWAP